MHALVCFLTPSFSSSLTPPSPPTRTHHAQGSIATPEEVAARESLLAPPLLRVLEALRLVALRPRVLLAPGLASLVRAACCGCCVPARRQAGRPGGGGGVIM